MPYKKSTPKVVRRKKKRSFSFGRKHKSSKRRSKTPPSSVIFYIIFPLVGIALLYISTLFIIRMRNRESFEVYEEQYVIGLEDIPIFPNSEFIFTNSINEPSVANFISSGNSAYRLPPNTSITKVYEYYEDVLPRKDWTFVLSVDIGSEEMKNGQYWTKKGVGLRIYSKFNDIWYELLSEEQAITGLRERVEREIERDLLLANQELQDLLPDFPWVIQIPKEYIISYRVSDFENLRLVEFKRIGSEERLIITPIGYIGSKPLDDLLREYVELLNKDGENLWNISNTLLTYTEYGRALRGTITENGRANTVAVIPNPYDKIMYVLDYNLEQEEFFEFVLSNLEPQGLKKE